MIACQGENDSKIKKVYKRRRIKSLHTKKNRIAVTVKACEIPDMRKPCKINRLQVCSDSACEKQEQGR